MGGVTFGPRQGGRGESDDLVVGVDGRVSRDHPREAGIVLDASFPRFFGLVDELGGQRRTGYAGAGGSHRRRGAWGPFLL